jgi:hypothetical protein
MPDNGDQWTALDSENERLVDPANPAMPVPPMAQVTEAPPAAPRHGRHRRRAVAAASAAVLAVGGMATAMPGASAAAAGSGTATSRSWQTVLTSPASDDPAFTAVAATGTQHAWAFESPGDGSATPAAWHLTPAAGWHQVTFPGQAGETVRAAGGSSARNVWAFTQDGLQSEAFRWNGTSWAADGSFTGDVGGTVVLSSRNAWAFGAPGSGLGARHFNGTRWKRVSSGHSLNSGSALSAHSIWAVGGKKIAHWNGHRWSRTSVASIIPPNTEFCDPTVSAIYARSSHSVYAVGLGNCEDEIGPGFLLHYNGQHWRRLARHSSFGAPVGVVPDGRHGLWIPTFVASGGPVHMVHYSDGHLRNAQMPVGARRLGLLGIAAVGQTKTSFAVGSIFKRSMPSVDQTADVFEFRR